MFIDKDKDYNDIAPYDSRYKSVFEGVVIEMHLVDHCNLQCAGCNHFANIAEENYISLESFVDQLKICLNKIPTIKRLIILGGEPTLHPNFQELCIAAREVLPLPIEIEVMTNGLNFDKVIPNLEEYKKRKIGFSICYYPGYTNIPQSNYIVENKGGMGLTTRLSMHQTMVDPKGEQPGQEQFFHCGNHQLPCIQIKDYKLYLCPFAAYIDNYSKKFNINIPKDNTDYLDIRTMTLEELHNFCFSPKHICNYCIQNGDQWPWHKSSKKLEEYKYHYTDMYFQDYDQYETIVNNYKKYFLDCLNEKLNPSRHEFRYDLNLISQSYYRFGHGKIDIIIPYYTINKTQIKQLYNTLVKQTLISECVIYLVSDNSTYDKEVIEYFQDAPFTCVFLRNKSRLGPGGARNKGIKNSYNKYIIFLDSDDYFTNDKALELLYEEAESNNYNIIDYYFQDNAGGTGKGNLMCKREYLEKEGIYYKESFYQGEDYLFNLLSAYLTPAGTVSSKYSNQNNISLGCYNIKNNQINIRASFNNLYLSQICSFTIAFYEISKKFKEKNIFRREPLEQTIKLLINLFNKIEQENNEFIEIYYLFFFLSFYICYNTNQSMIEELLKNDNKLCLFLKFYKNNSFKIKYNEKELLNINQVYEECNKNKILFSNNILILFTFDYYFKICEEIKNET